jgi:TetR/AcrR family transcriptional repressor of nem operon
VLEQRIWARLGVEFGVLDVADAGERRRRLFEILRLMLGDDHGADELSSLTAAAGGAGDAARAVYQLRISRVVALIMPAMPGDHEEQARRAWAVVAAVVGAISVARALSDQAHRGAVREAALRSVEAIVTER